MKRNVTIGDFRAVKAGNRPRLEWSKNLPASPGDRFLYILGSMYFVLYAVFFVLPAGYGGWIILLNYIVAITFTIGALIRRPNAFPMSFPIVMILILQVWSFVCAMVAERTLGRPIKFGRADTYMLMAMIPVFVSWRTAIVQPEFRRFAIKVFVFVFGLSAIVAWGQFLRLPPAMALSRSYTYKSIDNWDGHPGIRAVGLSMQPNYLAYEAAIALALVCSPVVYRKLKPIEIALGALFAGAALFSQSRAGLIPVAIMGLTILVCLVKRDPKQGGKVIGGLVAATIVALVIGTRRFEYMTMTTSGNDYSAQIREDTTWAQLNPILRELPFTGIGPSAGLLLGSGPEDKWVPLGRVVESGYLTFQAMYGIPGLVLQIAAIFGSIVAAVLAMYRTRDELQGRLLATGAVCALCLGINANYFNTFDSYLHLPLACFVVGLAAVTTKSPYRRPGMRFFFAVKGSPSGRRRHLARKLPS